MRYMNVGSPGPQVPSPLSPGPLSIVYSVPLRFDNTLGCYSGCHGNLGVKQGLPWKLFGMGYGTVDVQINLCTLCLVVLTHFASEVFLASLSL